MGAKKIVSDSKPISDLKMTFNSQEAMQYVGWGPTKFWELVNTGKIKGRKDGRWRFDRVQLDNYKKRASD